MRKVIQKVKKGEEKQYSGALSVSMLGGVAQLETMVFTFVGRHTRAAAVY